MQFVRNGPDIPERLLQLHEEGRVVFFCGAGISIPAGLPTFGGLVQRILTHLVLTPNPVQQAAINAKQFDTAVGLIEADLRDGRDVVRQAIATALTPPSIGSRATATHDALLTLSQDREGKTRLVTTNFDRLFERVIAEKGLSVNTYRAPLLPIPKAKWDGLVYLHGLLDEIPTLGALGRLVVSSGDFGLAYLTERWAARFVSELFRGYTVCFVGYGINDAVLRYMMDALAADAQLGEFPPEMFAFGSYSKGQEFDRENDWKAKNVSPILYREHRNHAYLHKTLQAWGETYRDGVLGKERIVVRSAISRPLTSTKQDDFVGRMLWALCDPLGLPARRFAELDPVPSLDWLECFADNIYKYADLPRFGVTTSGHADEDLVFSLTHRPAPLTKAPWMALAHGGGNPSQWDLVMEHVAHWLVRHLDDPRLLLYLSRIGGQLHDRMVDLIEKRLDHLSQLSIAGNQVEIARLRANAPNAIPSPRMLTLWRLMLNGRVRPRVHDSELFRWRRQFKRDGLTASTRIALRSALTPCITVTEPFRFEGAEPQVDASGSDINYPEWQIELRARDVRSALPDPSDSSWTAVLPELLSDFSSLLRDALDLLCELGAADRLSDHTYVRLPSIAPHPQNRDYHDWTALIELTRDAWLATAKVRPDLAIIMSDSWALHDFPIFRRLAFFAATQSAPIAAPVGLGYLLDENGWWLWSVETQRETIRLLVSLTPRLDATLYQQLESKLLAGPPRAMFKQDIDEERWRGIGERAIWLRLATMENEGVIRDGPGVSRLREIRRARPNWQVAPDERDEFPFWMQTGLSGEYDPWQTFVAIPTTRRGLLDYVSANAVLPHGQEDDWRRCCTDRFQATAYALCQLSQRSIWPAARWRDALQAWSEERLSAQSWNHLAPLVSSAPNELLREVASGVSWWLHSVADSKVPHEPEFFRLAVRILDIDFDANNESQDLVFESINHPVGRVTQALLKWWYTRALEDRQLLPPKIVSIFSLLCDPRLSKFRHARLVLSTYVVTLFRVDKDWTTRNLLPLFNWNDSEDEARIVWLGYLRAPRLHRPLFESFKPAFLDTAKHYSDLGRAAETYASLLVYGALDMEGMFNPLEVATAVQSLPPEGVHEVAKALLRSLGDKKPDGNSYWSKRVRPFWDRVWPKSNDYGSRTHSATLAQICIAAGADFPDAVSCLRRWLSPVDAPYFLIDSLLSAGCPTAFPEASLVWLDAIIGDDVPWLPAELSACLDQIAAAKPELRSNTAFKRLHNLARQHGH